MVIPTNSIEAVIFGIDMALEVVADAQAYERVANGITSKAESEGRDVTPEEQQIVNAMLADAVTQRKGKTV